MSRLGGATDRVYIYITTKHALTKDLEVRLSLTERRIKGLKTIWKFGVIAQ